MFVKLTERPPIVKQLDVSDRHFFLDNLQSKWQIVDLMNNTRYFSFFSFYFWCGFYFSRFPGRGVI